MTKKHYEAIDLNLLVIFDAVMVELNVTRAAEKLSMTQPGVSKALNRLRRVLNDDLFVKVPSGVKPTPKALEMWRPIHHGLSEIRQVTQPSSFNPATTKATFTLAMADYAAFLLVPLLTKHLAQLAPNIDIRVIPGTKINAPALLEHSEIDLAIGASPDAELRLRSHTLFAERYVCAMQKNHPLAKKKLTLQKFVQAKHLLVTLTGEATGFIDRLLQEKGLRRRIAITINQFALAPVVVANSDLIAALNCRTIRHSGLENQLHLTQIPLDLEPIPVKMVWHERSHCDLAHTWLRSLLIQVCENI